ncbi:hypothetical protein PTSG_07614 [Salpingoeca rosetta]|uniref:Uncharacterized protein n=1 Tax=Salpingoeca rosetta (strain ATCC 50818 / BSB-021) TaxID=946362 RepID=F2UH98_SALR5|nr:uncharacterized protein PTSG_07614 [Salpingoeca rosetta]EGD76497.1 hypothetical protein PTSG_07614 [Salpingoeca rosetta]|eukprot:XP_004991411.1 hypothetical protein PTSG_07614 [Salpingoeca rosetta]
MYFSMFDWTSSGRRQWAWTPQRFRQHQHNQQHQLPHHAPHEHATASPSPASTSSTAAGDAAPHHSHHKKKGHKRKDSDILQPMTRPLDVPRDDPSTVVLLESPAHTIHVDGSSSSSINSSTASSAVAPHSGRPSRQGSYSAVLIEAPLSPTMHRRHSNTSTGHPESSSSSSSAAVPAAHSSTAGVATTAAASSAPSALHATAAAVTTAAQKHTASPLSQSSDAHRHHHHHHSAAPAAAAAASSTSTTSGSSLSTSASSSTSDESQHRRHHHQHHAAADDADDVFASPSLLATAWLSLASIFASVTAPTDRAGGDADDRIRDGDHDARSGAAPSRGWRIANTKRRQHQSTSSTKGHHHQQQHQQHQQHAIGGFWRPRGGKTPGPPRTSRTFKRVGAMVLAIALVFAVVQVGLYLSMSDTCAAKQGAGAHQFEGHVRPPIVEYYIHGHGRGHASRGKTVIEALERVGYKVCVFVDDHVADLVRTVGAETVSVKSLPIANSVHSVWETLKIFVFRYLTDADCSICDRAHHTPDLVISDGDFPGVWRASRAGIPAIALGHGYLFSTTEKPDHVSDYAWGHQEVLNGRTTRLAKCTVDVSFVPLTPLNSNTTIVAKPRLRDAILRTERVLPPKKMVVVYFRDHGSGQHIFEELNKSGYEVRAFGPQKLDTPYVHVRAFTEKDFITSMSEASAVIATSGDNLIAECMWLGIPMMAMYDAADSEQMLNAEMFERTGLGVASSFQSFTPDRLQSFLSQLPTFQARAMEHPLGAWDAPDTIDAALECVQRASPVAKRWHNFAGGADNDITDVHRRHLSQLARAV